LTAWEFEIFVGNLHDDLRVGEALNFFLVIYFLIKHDDFASLDEDEAGNELIVE
jgi:hypothetical protein